MKPSNRRQFLFNSGLILGLNSAVKDEVSFAKVLKDVGAPGPGSPASPARPQSAQGTAGLYNTDLRTAVGLGDEPPGLLDKFGQLKSRRVETQFALGTPPQPADQAEWSQSLQDGYLPMVETRLRTPQGEFRSLAFASEASGLKADYVEVESSQGAYRVTLLFPFTTSVTVGEGMVTSGGKLLASFPPPKKFVVSQAKYNLLTRESWSLDVPPWEDQKPFQPPPGLDSAFAGGRRAVLNRWIEYSFPVTSRKTYTVFLGLLEREAHKPGEMLLRLSVNGQSQLVDLGLVQPGTAILRKFTVSPEGDEIRVKSECDPSCTDPYRPVLLNGIWVFEGSADRDKVRSGEVSRSALFYVPCGKEPARDVACSVVLDYEPAASGWIRLPYDASAGDATKVAGISPESAQAATKQHWDSFLQNGAEFRTGISHLDNLYRTSLINLLLLRTKHRGAGSGGADIYVVKPGPHLYDNFWTRDGAYMAATFDLAGHSEEAERSLRLFWQTGLKGMLASWGQQPSGVWQAPITEWDAQGQALWTLASHYEFTRDMAWLRRVYASIRRGVLWMKDVTEQTQFVNENGERPISYGLLPVGEGEAIAYGYNYYHCFWGALGLRQAVMAAQALEEKDDLKWMKPLYAEYSSNLLASVKLAYQRVGQNKFIPATPFDPKAPIWGSMTALYPARFLDPHDSMMTGTLELLDAQRQEDTYLYEKDHLWTYITVEGAMCHLLRDELPMFYTLFNGYVSHASPTNAWVEGILLPSRRGTGDMPHGWGPAG